MQMAGLEEAARKWREEAQAAQFSAHGCVGRPILGPACISVSPLSRTYSQHNRMKRRDSAAGQMALAKVRKLQEQNAELTRRLEAGT